MSSGREKPGEKFPCEECSHAYECDNTEYERDRTAGCAKTNELANVFFPLLSRRNYASSCALDSRASFTASSPSRTTNQTNPMAATESAHHHPSRASAFS